MYILRARERTWALSTYLLRATVGAVGQAVVGVPSGANVMGYGHLMSFPGQTMSPWRN